MRLRLRRRVAAPRRGSAGNEWQSRPVLSRLLRVGVFVTPLGGSLIISFFISHLLPRATSWQSGLLWIAVIGVLSLSTLVLFERLARRLLPLAALMNVSLIFPDKAPARFAMARKVGSPRDLQDRLKQARSHGKSGDASALQGVIELVLALSVHDKGTRGHSERVRVYTELIADELKLDPSARNKLRWAALLHDIGKLEVPAEVLNKTEKLSDADWHELHQHPENGARLIAPLLPWLGEWGMAVAQHHERYDGTGYPNRVKGKDISLAARIVSVADTYEVMTAPRPYKRPMSVTAARRELTRVAGTQLDPDIVRAFLNVSVGRLWRAIGFGAWVGQLPAVTRLFDGLGSFGGWIAPGAATMGAVGVIAIAGLATPTPLPRTTNDAYGSSTVSQGSGGAAAAGQPAATPGNPLRGDAGGDPTPAASNGPRSSDGAGSRPTAQPGQSESTGPTAASQPSSDPTAQPTPTATPTATPTPTPAPTPNPGSCAACTNKSGTCKTDCNNNNLPDCTQFCDGNNNSACLTSCFGNNNSKCTSYCYGGNNPKCQSNCYKTNPYPPAAEYISARTVGHSFSRSAASTGDRRLQT